MRKFLLSLAALFSAATVFADTYQTTIESTVWSKAGTQTLSDVDWTLATDGGYFGYATKGQQIGSGSNPATTVTLSTNGIAGTITSIVVNTSGASSVVATVSASVGGTNYGDAQSISASATNYTFTGSASGEIVLSWANSSAKALYVKSIVVEYTPAGGGSTDPVAVESVSITDSKGEALGYYTNLTVSETLQLKAVVSPANATNKKVSWEAIQDSEVIRVEDGLVTALAPGLAAVVVTTEDGEKQAFNYINVTAIADTTIAAFIANEGMTCYLTGTVSEITNTTYGNFTLTDASGSIIVYGCLTPEGESKKFADLNVKEGDVVKVLAKTYEYYKGTTHEAKDVVFVQNFGTPAPAVTFEVTTQGNDFTITPSDLTVQYYVQVVPFSEEYTQEYLTEVLDEMIADMGAGLEYFEGVSTQSLTEDWYADAEESLDYLVVICAVDKNYKRCSEVSLTKVKLETGTTPTWPTVAISFDSLTNTVTFTPSDLDAYYFATAAPVAYLEAMEATIEDMVAGTVEGWSWADLTDESDPILYKGVYSAPLDDLIAQVGEMAYGEWTSIAVFFNDKLEQSEATKFNFTINEPKVAPTWPTVSISFDSLTNTVTFTPSDLDAYYFATAAPVAYLEAMEATIEDMVAGTVEGWSWADLTDESDPILYKGVYSAPLDDLIAQVGEMAYGEWTSIAVFFNDKLEQSEATKFNFTINEPKVAPTWPTVAISFDSLTNTVTFTPSDLDAYYFATAAPVAYLEAMEATIEDMVAGTVEGWSWADLTDESDPILYKGVYSAPLDDLIAQVGEMAYGEWTSIAVFFNDKLEQSEATKFNFTINEPKVAPTWPTVAISFDSLTNTVTFTPSDLDAYYFATAAPVAYLEAIEATIEDMVAGTVEGWSWADLTDESDPILYKGVYSAPLDDLIAQVGEMAYGEWTSIAVFFNDKLEQSEATKFNFTIKEPTTGIATVASSAVDAPIYNVLGQRVNASAKGLLIRSNKTVVIK